MNRTRIEAAVKSRWRSEKNAICIRGAHYENLPVVRSPTGCADTEHEPS